MRDKLMDFFIASFFIPGLFLGIEISTGIDVSETGLVLTILDALCNTINISIICGMVIAYRSLFTIIFLLPFIWVLLKKDKILIIASVLFFLSGISLVFSQTQIFGIILFFIALFLLIFSEDKNIQVGGFI